MHATILQTTVLSLRSDFRLSNPPRRLLVITSILAFVLYFFSLPYFLVVVSSPQSRPFSGLPSSYLYGHFQHFAWQTLDAAELRTLGSVQVRFCPPSLWRCRRLHGYFHCFGLRRLNLGSVICRFLPHNRIAASYLVDCDPAHCGQHCP